MIAVCALAGWHMSTHGPALLCASSSLLEWQNVRAMPRLPLLGLLLHVCVSTTGSSLSGDTCDSVSVGNLEGNTAASVMMRVSAAC